MMKRRKKKHQTCMNRKTQIWFYYKSLESALLYGMCEWLFSEFHTITHEQAQAYMHDAQYVYAEKMRFFRTSHFASAHAHQSNDAKPIPILLFISSLDAHCTTHLWGHRLNFYDLYARLSARARISHVKILIQI